MGLETFFRITRWLSLDLYSYHVGSLQLSTRLWLRWTPLSTQKEVENLTNCCWRDFRDIQCWSIGRKIVAIHQAHVYALSRQLAFHPMGTRFRFPECQTYILTPWRANFIFQWSLRWHNSALFYPKPIYRCFERTGNWMASKIRRYVPLCRSSRRLLDWIFLIET